ncbi:leucine-rich repeat-containing protein 69 isoform X2 [Notolabrus celidotus]|uniref:leucine-rich repeat-containing protein 69 isoform X2 n=1 Tax=Notolabrus celidotus TaxID=1203425 RepID=UPI00148F6568|nr:leucine-rich repeat-containing protein 69 isoform X2 [Notolabrus celidotus]
MADHVVRAVYAQATSLTLSSKKIKEVPECVFMLTNLSVLRLNNNSICCLPDELSSLQQLSELNLGNNALKEVPAVLGHLESLNKLYLFSNQIRAVPPEVIGSLRNLVVLNLNHNHIQRLPAEIKSLSRLPQQLYQCKELTKLHVARNNLTSLPGGIQALSKLQVLDVAGNKLSMFPVEFHQLHLKELYFEDNRFVCCEPLPSVQDVEVLTLKELVARFVLQEDRNRSSLIHRMLPFYPSLVALLANNSYCVICLSPFLTTWLECVHFISLKKDMKMRSSQTIPVRAPLCSYKCLNTNGHSYYGVASR